ncbi:NADPH-dependent FMN reductase, partial [Escherichia coli]|uniref:NADPH-dependent FMN reductase n=1 Tax=Escherichia coli TaxID=562 RepID=UPI0013D2443E
MLNLALIIGSTRPQRFADVPAQWIAAGAAGRDDFALDILDLRDQDLPLFEEPVAPGLGGG